MDINVRIKQLVNYGIMAGLLEEEERIYTTNLLLDVMGLSEYEEPEDVEQEELEIILKQMVEVYRSVYGSEIVKVVLYGSYARGDNQADSDIDIVAIVHGDRVYLQEGLKKVWDRSADLELEYGTIISPTVIPFDEYEKWKNALPYYKNIELEGVEIVAQ